jgi:N-methylhydantoinase B
MTERYGVARLRQFVAAWLDYSERRVRDAVRELPEGRLEAVGQFGPASGAPDGIPVKVTVEVDHTRGRVEVDLRDNPDCVPSGLNMTEATATNAAIVGIVIALNSRPREDSTPIPLNAGAFRNFDVKLRDNCVLGIPRHPASCSMATGGPSKTVVLLELAALADLTTTLGSAYPGNSAGPGDGVVSGFDPRTGKPFVTQLFCGTSGGPATAGMDGWLSFLAIGAAGLLYRDSIEVLEQKYPIMIRTSRLRPDSEGAGHRRGAPGNIAEYGPIGTRLMVHYLMDGPECLPRGVNGGQAGKVTETYIVREDGTLHELDAAVNAVELHPGELIGSRSGGGGGFGDPLSREPDLVLGDVREGYLTPGRATSGYGVILSGNPDLPETIRIDNALTEARRRR